MQGVWRQRVRGKLPIEFRIQGQVLDEWAYRRGVSLNFIRPGKPVENTYVESFNGRFRDECLNEPGTVHRPGRCPESPSRIRRVLRVRGGQLCYITLGSLD